MRTGTYTSDSSRVRIDGIQGIFVYITFLDGQHRGISCKVPASWVKRDEA